MAGRNIGGLWTGKEGSKAKLSGVIDLLGLSIRVAIFQNTEKKNERGPDYSIVSYGIDEKSGQTQPQQEQQQGNSDQMPF
jgi:uncharacterized protein (DUF736 family)